MKFLIVPAMILVGLGVIGFFWTADKVLLWVEVVVGTENEGWLLMGLFFIFGFLVVCYIGGASIVNAIAKKEIFHL